MSASSASRILLFRQSHGRRRGRISGTQSEMLGRRLKLLRIYAVASIVAVYVAALNLLVVQIDIAPYDNKPGTVLVVGHEALRGLWEGVGVIPELANVALGVGVLALLGGKLGLAKLMGLLGAALALSALYVFDVYGSDLRAGYYLWLCCMLILTVAAQKLGQAERAGGSQ